jgi:hypothetical protein
VINIPNVKNKNNIFFPKISVKKKRGKTKKNITKKQKKQKKK